MSTTFSCPESPRIIGKFACRYSPCTPENRCGYCDNGIEDVNEAEVQESEYNMGSGNAARVLRALDLWYPGQGQPLGSMSADKIPQVLEKLEEKIKYSSDEDLVERLVRLKRLLIYAQENSFIVDWG